MKATATSPTRSKDRSAWLPILKQSIDEVFEVMLGYRLETPSESDKPEALEFTALVGLAGELCGVVIFRCSAHSAVRMTSKMLGLNVDPARGAGLGRGRRTLQRHRGQLQEQAPGYRGALPAVDPHCSHRCELPFSLPRGLVPDGSSIRLRRDNRCRDRRGPQLSVPGRRMLLSRLPMCITGGHCANNLLLFEYHASEEGVVADGNEK